MKKKKKTNLGAKKSWLSLQCSQWILPVHNILSNDEKNVNINKENLFFKTTKLSSTGLTWLLKPTNSFIEFDPLHFMTTKTRHTCNYKFHVPKKNSPLDKIQWTRLEKNPFSVKHYPMRSQSWQLLLAWIVSKKKKKYLVGNQSIKFWKYFFLMHDFFPYKRYETILLFPD